MLLNQTAIYALRAMCYLALNEEKTPMRSKDLSEGTNIPVHYLSKIMRRMVTSGLVESQKGHGGGFVLAKPVSEIRFVDILDVVDHQTEAGKCVFDWKKCNPLAPCPLHPFWSQLNMLHIKWAEGNTLKNVQEGTAEPIPERK